MLLSLVDDRNTRRIHTELFSKDIRSWQLSFAGRVPANPLTQCYVALRVS